MDAHPAVLAIEYNVVLYTADNDFSCFSGFQILPPQQQKLTNGLALA
jgi:hypothetical protein